MQKKKVLQQCSRTSFRNSHTILSHKQTVVPTI